MKNVAVLGSGVVGEILADGFLKHGYAVMRGTRDPAKLADWKTKAGDKASTGTFAEAAKFGALVVLAVKGSVAEEALKQAGHDNLAGKTVIDATNPIAEEKPENGVLRFTTSANQSLMEQLQKAAPEVRFVKAFNSVGNAHMVNPDFGGEKPTMFICGNDDAAKDQVRGILTQFGWDTADMGTATSARAIEPLCMLWCIPAIREGKMGHAFKLLRK
jgi:predicted dinucleotide-binding enzyme